MINDNISDLRQRITRACSRAKRDVSEVSVIAVSKSRPCEQIMEVIAAGITNIGENRVQEAKRKIADLTNVSGVSPVKWHLVGHLQTNKVREALKMFDLIHSVDSLHLAVEIDKAAAACAKRQEILLQVNTSFEETKFGLSPDQAFDVILEISRLKNIIVKGLMTIAPMVSNQDEVRPYFRKLKELKDKYNKFSKDTNQLQELSMGMSDDFEAAIEEGATMIRVGRAIFSGQ